MLIVQSVILDRANDPTPSPLPLPLKVNCIIMTQFNGKAKVKTVQADKWKGLHVVFSDLLPQWIIPINI